MPKSSGIAKPTLALRVRVVEVQCGLRVSEAVEKFRFRLKYLDVGCSPLILTVLNGDYNGGGGGGGGGAIIPTRGS